MAPHPLSVLPRPLSHFLGYRPPGTQAIAISPPPLKKALTLTIALIFAFAGLSVIQSVFLYDTIFTERHLPGLITSYGATAILVFGIPASPLAQPRAVIFGHFLSGLTGLIIYELFNLMPASNFAATNWLGGSLATAIALVVMDLTGTTHPPAGATAILPVVQDNIIELGWNYLWILLLSSVLIVGVGCVGNNILGRYPTFWLRAEPIPWFSVETPKEAHQKHDANEAKAVENGVKADFDHVRGAEESGSGRAGSGSTRAPEGDDVAGA